MLPRLAVQVTAVLLMPVTEAANWNFAPELTVDVEGATETLTAEPAGVIVSAALPFTAKFAALVAVTLTKVFDVTVGAVKRPLPEIEPALALHFTAVSFVPVTDAVNCSVLPEAIESAFGVTETFTLE